MSMLERGAMRRRLRTLRRRREALLLDLGALVLELHRHSRFLPDAVERRAAEAKGVDEELRALSETLGAGDGAADLVAAGVGGNCGSCGAIYSLGGRFCSQCGARLPVGGRMPRRAELGRHPATAQAARPATRPQPVRETLPQAPPVVLAPPDAEPDRNGGGDGRDDRDSHGNGSGESRLEPPPPAARRARSARVRQRLNEPARSSQRLPAGLIAGIAGGALVIALGILLLSGDGGGEQAAKGPAAQTPIERAPEPPPDDEAAPAKQPAAKRPTAAMPGALEPIEAVSAGDYDPGGDEAEHSAETRLAVDGQSATSWPTEEYETGTLPKDGVGLYLEPPEPQPARGLDLETPTPGFDVTVYAAPAGELPKTLESGWVELANEQAVEKKGRIDLDAAGKDFAYYLIWITKLPAEEKKVELSEARLLR